MSAKSRPSIDVRALVVVVNGVERHVPTGTTLAALVDATAGTRRGVAAAVDREVVPRSRWDSWHLHDGSVVDVVAAAAGG